MAAILERVRELIVSRIQNPDCIMKTTLPGETGSVVLKVNG
jgi:hypothetical protein